MQRYFLIFIASLSIGVVILPQTIALFAGQHYWYNLSESWEGRVPSDVPCEKCHADIKEEMSLIIGPHMGETGFGSIKCYMCHRIRLYSYQFASVGESYTQFTPGKYAHAASSVACMDCHKWINHTEFDKYVWGWNESMDPLDRHYYTKNWKGGVNTSECQRCHGENPLNPPENKVPAAGGFGLTNDTFDSGILEAHNAFLVEARNNPMLKDENEACIACHTALPVKINWTRARSMEFEAFPGVPSVTEFGPHNWTLTEWQYNGTARSVVWGNTSGYGSTDLSELEWPGGIDSIYS